MRPRTFLQLSHRYKPRGFTLVELMVAMMAGLLIATAAFYFSKVSTKLLAQEARIASAQMAVLSGFQRLQADISRAGYMATPNLPRAVGFRKVCGYDALPPWLQQERLTGLRVIVGGSLGAPQVAQLRDGKYPDVIRIMGNLTTPESYRAQLIQPGTGGGHDIFIRTNDGPSSRSGFFGPTGGTFTSVFATGRLLRLVDRQGIEHYNVIATSTWAANGAYVTTRYPVRMRGELPPGAICGIDGLGTDTQVNVVNVVEYGIANLKALGNTSYNNTIYAAASETLGDAGRTELVRREWLVGDAAPVPYFQDPNATIVAEYAIDLRAGLWASNQGVAGLQYLPPSTALVTARMMIAEPYAVGDPPNGPESVRAVQLRLVTRSREVDRATDLDPALVGGNPALLPLSRGENFRVQVPGVGWARARSLMADISLANQRGEAQ